jgi:hypothetical protein
MRWFESKAGAALYARDTIRSSRSNCVLIITIKPGKYVGYFVHTAIEELSADIQTETFSSKPENT